MKILEAKEKITHSSHDFPIKINWIDKEAVYGIVVPTHWHEEHEIIKIIKGKMHYKIDSEQGTLEDGDILYINGGTLHSTSTLPEDECVYFCIIFDLAQFAKNDIASGKILTPLINGNIRIFSRLSDYNDEQIDFILNQISNILIKKTSGNALQIHGLLFMLLGSIIQNNYYDKETDIPTAKKNILQLKRVLSFIENNYNMPVTLQMLADQAGMSQRYFCCFFKQMTNFSPMEYLNKHRIEVACYHLISGEKNITEMAYACGFKELSYFIRVFKKKTGVTPKQYYLNSHG